MTRIKSNAVVQVQAQVVMLAEFSVFIGKTLGLHQIVLENAIFQLDGYSETEDEIIVAECWAHIGKAKVAQKHKIAADVLKLSLISDQLRKLHPSKTIKCFLIFADEEAANVIRSASWLSAAARHYRVVPHVVRLEEALLIKIREAQRQQDLRDLEHIKTDSKSAGAL
jgi:hypothetical protein